MAAAVICYADRTRKRTGTPVGHAGFRAKLRREIIKRAETTCRRESARSRRRVWLRDDDDGAATLGVTGTDARCLAALSRIDAIARAVRSGGDPRSLDQLRTDAALDLLIFGSPDAQAATSIDTGEAGWPRAEVHILVSQPRYLGLMRNPGSSRAPRWRPRPSATWPTPTAASGAGSSSIR